MSKFDRYVLSQLLVLFGFFSLILVAVYWINQAVQVFDTLISDGQSAGTVLALTAMSLPFVIAIVLPMSAFAASVYVTNRLNSESELVVVQATGFSPYRMARPYLVFAGLVALMVGVLFHVLVPAASRSAAELSADLANNVTSRFLTPGTFLHPTKGVTFYIGDLSPEGVLKSVFLTDARSAETSTTYIAREAFLLAQEDGPKLVMVDGIAQSLTAQGQRLAITRFDDFTYDIGRLISAARPPQPGTRQLSTAELFRADPALVASLGSSLTAFQWEAHYRTTQSLIGIIAVIVGFATLLIGAFSRFGVWRQILIAITLLIVIKMTDNAASGFARTNDGAWPALYLPLVIGGVTGWALLAYAGRRRRVPPATAEAPA